MKTKGLLFISCLAAGALIASPSFGKPAKKSAGMSQSKAKRVAPHTTQAMRNDRQNQNISPRMGSTRYYGGTRYGGTRSYAGRQYSGTRYYGGSVTPVPVTMATRAITMERRITMGTGGATEVLPSGRTSPLQLRRTSPLLCGRPGITAIRTRTMAVIRTEVTTTTIHTTRQRTAITHQRLQLFSGVLANSVITMA
jgi:hypothetical protein